MPELALEQPLRTVADISDDNLSLDDDEARDAKIEMLMDQLYEDAEKADEELKTFMQDVCKHFEGVSISPRTTSLKRRDTAKAKLTRGGGWRAVKELKDIARATLVFNDMESMYAARDYIVRQRCFTRLGYDALKNRYSTNAAVGGVGPTDQGYRDIKFFLAMEIRGPRRYHIVELQLNIVRTIMAKKKSHPFYDILRLAPANWTPTRPNSNITVTADVIDKVAYKLISATKELERRGIEVESARIVRDMFLRAFFRKTYSRTASGRRVFDGYDLKTGQSVTLNFNGAAGERRGLALVACSSAAYRYYKHVGRVYSATGRTAANMHQR